MADHAPKLKLPTKRDRIEWVQMTPDDRGLYDFLQRFAFAATTTRKPTTVHKARSRVKRLDVHAAKKKAGASTNILALISMLRLVCDHGEALLPALAQQAWRNRDPALLSWSMFEKEAGLRQCAACDSEIEDVDTVGPPAEEELACGHNLFWTKMLDLIAAALREKGVDFCRIDGRSTLSQRAKALDRFGQDPACTIVLASTGAAGEGIKLTAANSVHIVEPHWNPMAEEQAIGRIYRIGQKRDVEVVRYIVRDSIEDV
ncbi:hypothetical protein SBRCBS47491_001814 [Sporothrix bragantina]|uniref:Helicase C-terminal domain-containing protein n=1 Tax=Sporothrix bragantina TaxID=671064 RepID=A0ABP0B2D7_9PEZI